MNIVALIVLIVFAMLVTGFLATNWKDSFNQGGVAIILEFLVVSGAIAWVAVAAWAIWRLLR